MAILFALRGITMAANAAADGDEATYDPCAD